MEPAIKKAEDKLEYLSSDEETMNIYWERERSLHERANMISSAEERGIKKEKIETIKNAVKIGLDYDTIYKLTGASIEEIEEIKHIQALY